MEKHNPSSFTVDSSSPAHRSSFAIHDLTPYINWIYFFHAWGFQPRYAAIANIHGCDSCRAIWLTTFPEEERSKASEAMQLYKEANRMLNELDRDFEVKTIFKLCPANADGDNLIIDGITFPLLRIIHISVIIFPQIASHCSGSKSRRKKTNRSYASVTSYARYLQASPMW